MADSRTGFNCCVCGRFVGYETGKIYVTEVVPADYWNGIDEAVTAYCKTHKPVQPERQCNG